MLLLHNNDFEQFYIHDLHSLNSYTCTLVVYFIYVTTTYNCVHENHALLESHLAVGFKHSYANLLTNYTLAVDCVFC